MQLVDREIAYHIEQGHIQIYPFRREKIKSNSYDVRLGDEFIEYDFDVSKSVIDPYDYDSVRAHTTRCVDDEYVIRPFGFVLAETVETIKLESFITAQLAGKSSIARLGITVHQTAGFIDAGFEGSLTLEIFNCNPRPVKLYAGMDLAQLIFYKTSNCCKPYNERSSSKYVGQQGPQYSKYYLNDSPWYVSNNV